MSGTLLPKTMRLNDPVDNLEIRSVYILITGLTGAGKSTFISVVTGDDTLAVGDAGTMDGRLYSLYSRIKFSEQS